MFNMPEPFSFIWDKGNQDKNFVKHGVANDESEEVFFDSLKQIVDDTVHSKDEERYILIGHTKSNRLLSIAYTTRGNSVRIISARNASKKERNWYEEKVNPPKI